MIRLKGQQVRVAMKSGWMISGLLAGVLATGLAGCASQGSHADSDGSAMRGQAEGGGLPRTLPSKQDAQQPGSPGEGQETFATPDAAVTSLLAAVQGGDHAALHKIFGPQGKDLISGDPVADRNSYEEFAQNTMERATLEERNPDTDILHIGKNDWPFPIPIKKDAEGTWFFDTAAGEDEILARRIGANELEAISICRAYVQAQREYASVDHNKDEVLEYAQRLRSSPGKQDGLYWPVNGDQPQSPFGPLVAEATTEGYAPISGSRKNPEPFHGYYFHILKAQGSASPGGAYNYVINGHMIAGFALVAWPAEYGKSGVMTFIVNHQGKVYQKDLGPNTEQEASRMKEYNPDKSWTLVKE